MFTMDWTAEEGFCNARIEPYAHVQLDHASLVLHYAQETFGTGTAAVISPVGELNYKGEIVIVNDFKTGPLTRRLYDTLTGIQWGKLPDPYGWSHEVK